MQGQATGHKITIKTAADLLEVTTKTVQRYLAKGLLTKVKEGTRTLLLLAEVKDLKSDTHIGQGQSHKTSGKTAWTGQVGDTVTLSRERYEQLLLELGELRKQNQFFVEFKGILLAKEEAMHRLERDVEALRARVRALELWNPEELPAGLPQDSNVPSPTHEKLKTKPKKPWWQA
jgi:excisionase family DNA binding protein